MLQADVSCVDPEQPVPPLLGGGLVHERSRVFTPPPHDLLHCLQSPQFVNPPLTANEKENFSLECYTSTRLSFM